MIIKENLDNIKKNLLPDCQLIAVSKRMPAADIQEAYDAGHRDFGENYIQELTEKKGVLPNDIRWHFIGHLQRNKVKYIAPFVYLIHAVDSLKLLTEIDKQAVKNSKKIGVLLQVHIAQEETKFGFSTSELASLIESRSFDTYKNIELQGLMAMASNTSNMKQVSEEFASVKELADLAKKQYPSMTQISTGMSKDYPLAIENGSTYIRLGTSIFGQRS